MSVALLDSPEQLAAAPGTYPVPPGRGRWRTFVLARSFTADPKWSSKVLTELTDATSRKVTQAWCAPAQLDLTIDGHSPAAQLITELQTEILAMRWDDTAGFDRPVFRGVVDHSQDTLDGSSHVVTITAHDYLALLQRRFLTNTYVSSANRDQDDVVFDLLWNTGVFGGIMTTSSGFPLGGGSYLPIDPPFMVNPDGSNRGRSGQQRTRTYYAQSDVGTLLDQLAKVIGGFDYDVLPLGGWGWQANVDVLRLFYPQQGVTRTTPVLEYGSTVAALQRQVSSDDYANYWRIVGNNPSATDPSQQTYAESWNADANRPGIGLWQNVSSAVSADVTQQTTLQEQSDGQLGIYGVLIPSYSLTLAPNTWYYGFVNMGDTVPLVVNSGRLAVNTSLRVLGITYTIGDDGEEDVDLVVGRPQRQLLQLMNASQSAVNALARR